MADWRSPVAVSNSPWTQPPPHHYRSMDSGGSDEEKQQHGAATTPRGQVYNPFQLHPQVQPQVQPQSHPRPQRLHIDDLRESPMRHDLISLESNPRAPIVHEDPQPQPQPQDRPHPQSYPHPPQSVSSTEATSGSFLNQLVTGLWQPRRQAVPAAPAQELPAHYAQQQTPQQQEQRLSATRTFEDMLPRRSLLVPSPTEFDIGRRTLDPEELLNQPQRTTSPSMRNLHQFRPVAAPPGAPSSSGTGGSAPPRSTRVEAGRSLRPTPPQTEDERSRGASTATSSSRQQPRENNNNNNSVASRATSVERARQIFASKQVRLENSWYNDMWIYMKNAHPFIGIFGAHQWHPYKRRDRIVVLLVALLVTFLCCGMFATQKCCDVVLEVPIAVVGRRLSSSRSSINDLISSSSQSSMAQQCTPFYGKCDSNSDGSVSLCTQGSSCASVPGRNDKQCLPVVSTAASLTCGAADHLLTCPTGWSCDGSTHKCTPSSSLVCYLPRTSTSPASVSFATDSGADDGSGMTAIEAIFSILIIANNASTSSNSITSSSSGSGSLIDSSTDGGAIGSSSSGSTSSAVDSRNDQVAQSISVALTKPSDGGVYSVASSIPVEWEVSSLSGNSDSDDQPLKSFSVEFSADGKTFIQIASDVTASSEKKSSTADRKSAVFHYDWQLNNNASLLCTNCVLRVCAAVGDGASGANAKNSVCIRSDGGGGETSDSTTSSNLVITRSASAASRKGITFRIVREILQCSCGLAHASFVQFSYLIALVLPLTVLLLQQLVTFYQDSKLWGLFARRGGPEIPKLCFYGRGATRVGRVVIVVVLAAACLGSGFQVAQVNDATFYNQTGEIVLLWLGMYALCVLIGFVYCSAACLAIFSLRWKLELTHKSRVGHPPSDFDIVDVSVHVPSLEEEGRDGNRTPVLQA